jgi:hypothetical protein
MRTIYKYTPQLAERIIINTHMGAECLSIQDQSGVLCFWFQVDNSQPVVPRMFLVVGTGHEVPLKDEDIMHVESVQWGAFVWHIYEVFSEEA